MKLAPKVFRRKKFCSPLWMKEAVVCSCEQKDTKREKEPNEYAGRSATE